MSAKMYFQTFANKWFRKALPVTALDLTGRTVIVTGANVGLGFEAAKHFYSMNPKRLIITSRNPSKGAEAKRALVQSNKSETIVDIWELDLASFESTKKFAQKALSELDRLDILLSNAAQATMKWTTTKDGWETALQTNVLSTFLLVALLVPLVKKTTALAPPIPNVHLQPHIVIVSSDAHTGANFNERSASSIYAALNDERRSAGMDRYPTSKLLDLLLTKQLAKSQELSDQSAVVCSVNPGFCRSELAREFPWIVRQILYALLARTTEEGSRTYLWASLSDGIPPGSYTSSCTVERPSPFVESAEGEEVQVRLWKELSDILIKVAPETAPVWKVTG